MGERSKLRGFYLKTETDTLPPPSVQTLENSLRSGALLIAEDVTDGAILATAGYFDYIKSKNDHLIFELAGTRVTARIGRLSPFPLQQILLAIRLFQIASTEGRRDSVSVISSARHPKSIANLKTLRMFEITSMPTWLAYDTCSWTRMSDRASWRHFIANGDTLTAAIVLLEAVGFAGGSYNCTAERRRDDGTGERLDVAIAYDMPLRELFDAMLAAHNNGELACDFRPLPRSWP